MKKLPVILSLARCVEFYSAKIQMIKLILFVCIICFSCLLCLCCNSVLICLSMGLMFPFQIFASQVDKCGDRHIYYSLRKEFCNYIHPFEHSYFSTEVSAILVLTISKQCYLHALLSFYILYTIYHLYCLYIYDLKIYSMHVLIIS